ncbi:EAL domain-containing protein [Haloimpatiens sp. FM7330]
MFKLKSFIMKSIINKIKIFGIAIISIALIFVIVISHKSIDNLYVNSSKKMKEGLAKANKDYLSNYITSTSMYVETKIQHFLDEQSMLANIFQEFIDNEQEFELFTKEMWNLPYFKDKMVLNKRWYVNDKNEPSAVLVQSYLLDKNMKIKSEVMKEIKQSALLDLLMPSFYKHGAKKLWIYYIGDKNSPFLRVTPWDNLGNKVQQNYPKYLDKPLWDTFNPGLVEGLEEKIKSSSKYKNNLSSLAVVKSPYIDAGTGKYILSINYPIWNKERNKFKGSINIDVELHEILSYIEDVKLSSTGFAFISKSDGNIIAINDNGEKILGLKKSEKLEGQDKNKTAYTQVGRLLKDSVYDSVKKIKFPNSEKVKSNEIDVDGKKYLVIQKNITNLNSWSSDKGFYNDKLTLGFVVPKNELFASYINMQKDLKKIEERELFKELLIASLIIVLSILLIYVISNRMAKDLKKLEDATVDIMKGNYDINITVTSQDEIGRLANAMNKMSRKIEFTMDKIKKQNVRLSKEINNRKNKEDIINYLENYDKLTNLPKGKVFIEKLKDVIQKNKGSIIIVSIDKFRRVNEVFGYEGGNSILKMISNRLISGSENVEIISRINGDEFVLLYKDIATVDEIINIAESIKNILKHPFDVNGKEIYIMASIGISIFPHDTDNPYELLKYASAALSKAKEDGNDKCQFYDSKMNTVNETRIELIRNLKHALDNNEFELYYQPQVDLKTKKIMGLEALIRWNSREKGVVSPVQFIPLAEETGLIIDIGEWVVQTACRHIKALKNLGFDNVTIAVNISPKQFYQSNLISLIQKCLRETSLKPEQLEIEVTEGLFINDMDKVITTLRELRLMGIKVAVDDFGTGYSSLSYIKKLPIDKLKIDRTFIKDIPENDNGALSNIIIEMGKSLNLRIIAEGVEKVEQEEFLIERNCDEAQGFLYAKPLKFRDLIEILKKDAGLISNK